MKTKTTSNPRTLSRSSFTFLLAIAAVCLSVGTVWTAHAQSDLFASVNGTNQNGGGSILQFTPLGVQSTFFSPLDRPRGLVFDSSGNLFVATNTRNAADFGNIYGSIVKITPGGTATTFSTNPNPAFPASLFLEGLVTDGAGNLFVMAANNDPNNNASPLTTIYKVTAGGTVTTFTTFTSVDPAIIAFGLAFDGAGNLYAAASSDLTIYKYTPAGVRSVFVGPAAFSSGVPPFGVGGPVGLAFDGFGNLFVSTGTTGAPDDTSGTILKFAPDGTFLTTFATGLINPRGLAFDSVGNLYVAEVPIGTGNIREFTPAGAEVLPTFASGIGSALTNYSGGPEFLAFPPEPVSPVTSVGSNVVVNSGTVGSATDITVTYSQVTTAGTTTVTSTTIDPTTLPTGLFELPGANLAFDITTQDVIYTSPIIIAFQLSLDIDQTTFSALKIMHSQGDPLALVDVTIYSGPFAPNWTTKTIYASVSTLSPFVIAKERFRAQVQQPINPDGSSVFSVKRGVVPVTFTLTYDGVATCQLPPAKISVIRTAGTVVGSIDESTYLSKADKGSNFRISNCQYVYNLAASSLGVGKYKVNILIGGVVVGSGTFALK